jgi:hypothetical protein
MTDEDYEKSCKRENAVQKEIERLSQGNLKVKFKGFGAGVSTKIQRQTPSSGDTPLDLEVSRNGNVVAVVEVTGSNRYTFANSGPFPIALDKIERIQKIKVKTYFVFHLDLEPQPNMWWMSADKIAEYTIWYDVATVYGPQDFYATDKNAWTRGLQDLVKALLCNEK